MSCMEILELPHHILVSASPVSQLLSSFFMAMWWRQNPNSVVFCLIGNGEVVKAGIKLKFLVGGIWVLNGKLSSSVVCESHGFSLSWPTSLMKTWNRTALEGFAWRSRRLTAAEPQVSSQTLHPYGSYSPSAPGYQRWADSFALENTFTKSCWTFGGGFLPSVPSPQHFHSDWALCLSGHQLRKSCN